MEFNYLWIVSVSLLRVIQLPTARVDLDQIDREK